MSVVPNLTYGERVQQIELMKWSSPLIKPEDLVGKVVQSLEELKEKLEDNERAGELVLKEPVPKQEWGRRVTTPGEGFLKFGEYGWENIKSWKAAYECPDCKAIVIGPPRIDVIVRAGFMLIYSCTNCKKTLGSVRVDDWPY